MELTRNSGASLDDADLRDDHLVVECKVKGAMKGVSIPLSLIEKVKKQATKWRRDWAIVTRNAAGDDHITMPLDVFEEIYEKYRDYEDYGIRQREEGRDSLGSSW